MHTLDTEIRIFTRKEDLSMYMNEVLHKPNQMLIWTGFSGGLRFSIDVAGDMWSVDKPRGRLLLQHFTIRISDLTFPARDLEKLGEYLMQHYVPYGQAFYALTQTKGNTTLHVFVNEASLDRERLLNYLPEDHYVEDDNPPQWMEDLLHTFCVRYGFEAPYGPYDF